MQFLLVMKETEENHCYENLIKEELFSSQTSVRMVKHYNLVNCKNECLYC